MFVEQIKKDIRVLVADDHPALRTGLRAVIGYEPGFDVVGEAGDGEEVLRLAKELSPDVVVMDIGMPKIDGLEATRQLKQLYPDMHILVFTGIIGPEHVLSALKAGVDGYLHKITVNQTLLQAIRTVAEGKRFIDPALAADAIQAEAEAQHPLTGRALEVMKLAAMGLAAKEIATEFNTTEKAVECVKSRAMVKLGLTSRRDLLQYALRQGWLNAAR